jgi:hypothetical protein
VFPLPPKNYKHKGILDNTHKPYCMIRTRLISSCSTRNCCCPLSKYPMVYVCKGETSPSSAYLFRTFVRRSEFGFPMTWSGLNPEECPFGGGRFWLATGQDGSCSIARSLVNASNSCFSSSSACCPCNLSPSLLCSCILHTKRKSRVSSLF